MMNEEVENKIDAWGRHFKDTMAWIPFDRALTTAAKGTALGQILIPVSFDSLIIPISQDLVSSKIAYCCC